jgi:hypothetical protein
MEPDDPLPTEPLVLATDPAAAEPEIFALPPPLEEPAFCEGPAGLPHPAKRASTTIHDELAVRRMSVTPSAE